MDNENELLLEPQDWLKEYKRARNNPIYFLELYFNKAYPNKAVELNDQEKQELFDKFYHPPIFKTGGPEAAEAYTKYSERIEKLKAKGYKDWEIL